MKMNRWNWKRRSDRASEAGQAMLFVLLILGIFLLGALCFAFDLSNMWFHRQAAQTAADAACAAGAMDILVDSQGGATGKQGFILGTPDSCTNNPTYSICKYAASNGYNSVSTNAVSFSFPASVPGVTIPPSGIAGAYPFIRVDVVDHVQTFFVGLLNGSTSKDVRAFSTCGVELAQAPVPILILNPTSPGTFSPSGITIYGGGQRAIQVNSSSSSAAGGGSVDTSQGGPNLTGSDFGVFGGPPTTCCSFNGGTTGQYIDPAAPISDPLAQVPAPQQPSHTGTITSGVIGNGCRDISCDEYSPGYYPSGIDVKNKSAIFDPGIYYIKNGFTLDSNSCAWPSTAAGDGSGGTMFYLANNGPLYVKSNSGKKCSFPLPFNMTSGSGSLPYGAFCDATSVNFKPKNLPSTTNGTILLAPCRAPTGINNALCDPNCLLNYGDPLGPADPSGEQRGILFFQNRSVASVTADWGGGGQLLLSGTIYIHQCTTGGGIDAGGTGCNPSSAYTDTIWFHGNPSSGSFIIGEIITDSLSMNGAKASITMDLITNSAYNVLKASIFQ